MFDLTGRSALVTGASGGIGGAIARALYRQGATVTIRTKDGRAFTNTVFEPKGSAACGIAWDDVDTKYRTLLPHAQIPERQIAASLAMIHEFRGLGHVSTLIDLLRT